MKHLVKERLNHIDACSQFSIAMATGLPLEDVAKELGWSGMSTPAIVEFLVRKGYSNGETGKHGDVVSLQGTGILIIQSKKEGHAVAFEDGIIYDPNGRLFYSVLTLVRYYKKHDDNGLEWAPRAVVKVEKVKTREWAVGGLKTPQEAV